MKNIPTNPFLITGYQGPDYFCDREKETASLMSALKNGRNITLISPRRMGKTGLIKNVFIIRKTKCSPLFKRSDISYKTKRPPKNNFPKYSRGSKKSTGKFCFSQCFFL